MPRKKKPTRRRKTAISKEIVDLLDKAFPDGVVELNVAPVECYLVDLVPTLTAKFRQVRGAVLRHERKPDPEQVWHDDLFDEPPSDMGLSASYHLFFLALDAEKFAFQADGEVEDDDGELIKVTGRGQIGCALAVSALAPVAVIRFTQMEEYEDGSSTEPDIWDDVFSTDFTPIQPDAYMEESFGGEALEALKSLRDRVARILQGAGITLLDETDAAQPVPWLKAGEDAFVGNGISKTFAVKHAFFFRRP